MTLNGVMASTLRYFSEFGKPVLQKTIMAEFVQESIVFLVRVSSRSLSHLLMSFLYVLLQLYKYWLTYLVYLLDLSPSDSPPPHISSACQTFSSAK